jgi:glutathione S-transferase
MILFHYPGACSLAAHIALAETGLPYQLVSINREKRTSDGRDFMKINPKGFIPALQLDDGTVLTETVVILLYIAHETGRLLPKDGLVRWRALEANSFMSTEIHGHFRPYFYPDATQAELERARHKLVKHFTSMDEQLGDKPYLCGDQITIADPYLFVMLLWASKKGVEVPGRLNSYAARLRKLPAFTRSLSEEGLD